MCKTALSDLCCEFPGDIRPLLDTDLHRVGDGTAELRRTNDWLLLQVANVFLQRIRRMDGNQAWATYAVLAEKLHHSPEEAARRAGSGRIPQPTVEMLARHYVRCHSDRMKFVPAEIIATQILPHLKLSSLDVSGARLYSRQKSSGVELNAVAECLLFGAGDMRDFRQSLGGQQCSKCKDFFYPGEVICGECGAIDWARPIRATTAACFFFVAAFGWQLISSVSLGRFGDLFVFLAALVTAGLLGLRALRHWKRVHDYYYRPLTFR